MLYLISFDLNRPGQNYSELDAALVRLGARKVLYSQWVTRSTSSAVQLRDYLRGCMDANDRVLVSSLDSAWAGWNLMTDPNAL
jgi:hypothetical protein